MVGLAAPAAFAAPDKPGKAVGNDNPNKGNGNNNAGGNGSNAGGNGSNAGGNGSNAGGAKKYYVCKWVGQPDVGEAAHHIVPVSGAPLQEGGFFNDKQGPSYVLPQGVPVSIDSCPRFGGSHTGSLATIDLVQNTCTTNGSIREPVSLNVSYTINGAENWAVTEGSHLVTATLINGATAFYGSTDGWTVSGTSATRTVDLLADAECSGLSASAQPIVDCGEWGSVSATDTALVDYSTAGDKWSGLEGDVVVTATLKGVATAFVPTSGWTIAPGGESAQRTFKLGKYTKCVRNDDDDDSDTMVSPRYASTTGATCSRDGQLVVPSQPQGVKVQRTGSVPGAVTFTYSPADGYAFPKGTDRKVTLQVAKRLTGVDCIKGVETVRPKPQPGNGPGGDGPAAGPANAGNDAEVLGEQAVAVPTAVAAGLGDTMTAATTTASPQLAQALVAAGLLMLVMGGATGLGRRTRGAHES